MLRLGVRSCLVAAGLAAGLAGACSYPDFGFGGATSKTSTSNGGSGGTGGAGGATTTTTSQTSTGSSSSSSGHNTSSSSGGQGGDGGTPVVTQVSCKDPAVQCSPGQVCCFHETTASLDKCGTAGQCGSGYLEFACNSNADCPGTTCCAFVDSFTLTVTGVACTAACNGSNVEMCDSGPDCSDGTCDPFPDSFLDYPNYGWCAP